jgi:peptidoglycan/LPS O-acetylase OafA/YrhL
MFAIPLCLKIGAVSAWSRLLFVMPACVVCSLAAAWLFYRVVEQRFLNSATGTERAGDVRTATAPALA